LACNSAICENWPRRCQVPALSAVLKPRRAISSGRSSPRTWCPANRPSAIVTRFPPEPNGRLHIGHAKAICIDFGIAHEFGGRCNLRFDDTNPVKESQEYVDEIERDIRWLGFDWGEHLYHASDYFEQLYQWAEQLVREGKAYVDSLTADQMREYRGTLTEPGRESPFRNRSVEENLDLFRRMRAGRVRGRRPRAAREDRHGVRQHQHARSGDVSDTQDAAPTHRGCVGHLSDVRLGARPVGLHRGVTYSLCSLEYEDHRPLYDWYLEALALRQPRPRQIEFARLNLNYTVMSKRMLLELVEGGHVAGWDDPRMPTIAGLRRRGYTPESIRNFCERIGVAKRNNVVDIANLEHAIREDLNVRAPRGHGGAEPAEGRHRELSRGADRRGRRHQQPGGFIAGTRKVPFGRELYIERTTSWRARRRSSSGCRPATKVRLRCAYFIRCTGVIKDPATGEITELRATYDPATRGGDSPDGRKVKATLHWVSAAGALDAEVRMYDRLFTHEEPAGTDNFLEHLNPNVLEVQRRAKGRGRASPTRPPGRATSSSGWATSAWIPIRARAASSSTARSRCAIRGPRFIGTGNCNPAFRLDPSF
jgi:glutaminyl-tRNA synthetase